MITKIIRANAALSTDAETGIKKMVMYLQLQHAVEHVKKDGKTNVLVTDRFISMSFKEFLHYCAEFLPEQYQSAPANEIAYLLEAAPIELTVRNYKAGDTYIDENGAEQPYSHAGSEIAIQNLQLSELTRKRFDEKKLEYEMKLNRTMAVLQAFKESGVDVEKITFSL